MPAVLKVKFAVVTPAFLGGADPTGGHETGGLRGASLRGALRGWYRAIAAGRDMRRNEDRIFGGLGDDAGQAAFLMRFDAHNPKPPPASRTSPGLSPWEMIFAQARPEKFNVGQGRRMRNGLKYLGFPLAMRGNEGRRALAPGSEMDVYFVDVRGNEADRRALVASIWLLGAIGGVGMRARRGFGSLSIIEWASGSEAFGSLLAELALPGEAASVAELQSSMLDAFRAIKRWLGFSKPENPDLDLPRLARGEVRFGAVEPGRERWPEAMNAAGRVLQDFRDHWAPDYEEVRTALVERRPLRRPPARVAFGLPLVFRSSAGPGTLMFNTSGSRDVARADRHASPLRLHFARIRGGIVPVWTRMGGPVPGTFPEASEQRSRRLGPVGTPDILERFMVEHVKGLRIGLSEGEATR